MSSPPVSQPTPRRAASANHVLFALASAVVGVVVTWWITVVQRIPVQSDADLASVRFGFPLPWITQDHSSNPFAAYPNDVELRLSGRTGISYPTDYEWIPFIADALIWGGLFWIAAMIALPASVRMLRAHRG